MAHYDEVLPGRVHRVFHEDLVNDPETEMRRLLAYCELPFEEQCLRFYETDRSVRTSSSEQVRRPIQKPAVEAWKHYESWLQPMKDALGDVLTCYPDAPKFGLVALCPRLQQRGQRPEPGLIPTPAAHRARVDRLSHLPATRRVDQFVLMCGVRHASSHASPIWPISPRISLFGEATRRS